MFWKKHRGEKGKKRQIRLENPNLGKTKDKKKTEAKREWKKKGVERRNTFSMELGSLSWSFVFLRGELG